MRIRQLTLEKLQNKAKTHLSDWFPLKYVVRLQLSDAYFQKAVSNKAADGWWGPPSHKYPISTEEPASYLSRNQCGLAAQDHYFTLCFSGLYTTQNSHVVLPSGRRALATFVRFSFPASFIGCQTVSFFKKIKQCQN